jgi:prepilin-type N-terminal cleavage/methylation domain-containing protein
MRRLIRFSNSQRGFTLIEMLIAVAVSGILATGIVTTTFQIYHENQRATRSMKVVQNVENAGFWVSRDALSAQNATSSGFPLILTWQDWGGNAYQITYDLVSGNLQRNVSVNGGTISQSIVAQLINNDASLTNYNFSNGVLTFTVTSTVETTSETRTYQIKLRPEPFSQ